MNEKSNNKNDIAHQLIQLDRLHHLCIDNEISKLGLEIHRNQHALLMYIDKNEGNIIQKNIAEKFDISQAAVANTLKSLEKTGYITRRISNNDTRSNMVCITEKGKNIINKSVECFKKVDNMMLESLSDQQIETLNDILVLMKDNLIKCKEGENNENMA